MTAELGRRERKKLATRRALTEAALELFAAQGFAETTVAQIAERADLSTRTFFLHFATKEDVLVGEGAARIELGLAALAAAEPGEGAVDALARALHRMIDGLPGADGAGWLPFRIAATTPSVRAHAVLQRQQADEQLATALHERFPGEVDEVGAAATVAAATAAAYAAALVTVSRGEPADEVRAAMHRAVEIALRGRRRQG